MEYKNFEVMIVDSGIIMISKSNSSDHPFVIMHSEALGLQIMHCGEIAYFHGENKLVNLRDTMVYHQSGEETSGFVLCIPFMFKSLDPKKYVPNIDLSGKLDHSAFPKDYHSYPNSAFVIGFPE
jgi:hypothetical protein